MSRETATPTQDLRALILASASPRRQELIGLMGLPFTIVPSRYQEPAPPTSALDLPAFVTMLAINKGQEVAERRQAELTQGALIVAADTLVTVADSDFGVPLGKPRDTAEAHTMLQQLSGRVHRVYTGLAVIGAATVSAQDAQLSDNQKPTLAEFLPSSKSLPSGLVLKTSAVCTRVRFRDLTDSRIADYIATGEPMDKAGAYGAQGYAAPFIESFEGDFFNVVGLPLCRLGVLLESLGVSWGQRSDNSSTVHN